MSEFLKDQVLVTKGVDQRTGHMGLVQVTFIADAGPDNCYVKDQFGDVQTVKATDLANILWAEEVLRQRAERSWHGF